MESVNILKVFREQYLGIQVSTPLLDTILQYSNDEVVADIKALTVSLNRVSGTYCIYAPSVS